IRSGYKSVRNKLFTKVDFPRPDSPTTITTFTRICGFTIKVLAVSTARISSFKTASTATAATSPIEATASIVSFPLCYINFDQALVYLYRPIHFQCCFQISQVLKFDITEAFKSTNERKAKNIKRIDQYRFPLCSAYTYLSVSLSLTSLMTLTLSFSKILSTSPCTIPFGKFPT
ncbi:hypothetical protein X777_09709, partial [Ooceraea biroi]